LDGAQVGEGASAVLARVGVRSLGPVAGTHQIVPAEHESPDLLAWSAQPRLAVRAALEVSLPAVPALRIDAPPGAPGPVAAARVDSDGAEEGAGRVVVLGIDVLASSEPL